MGKSILDYDTVALSDDKKAVVIIDQTLLPNETKLIELKTAQEIWDAIYLLKVRGAPDRQGASKTVPCGDGREEGCRN